MNDDRQRQRNEEPAAPARLVAALDRLQQQRRRRVVVPASVDDAVLSQAREHLRQAREAGQRGGLMEFWERIRSVAATSRFNWRKFAPWFAAATAVVLVAWLVQFTPFRRVTVAAEDVNHDGQVDILDAFTLARQIQRGERPQQPRLDLNGDGVIDERDVSIIAAHAVSLERRRHSS